MNATLTRRLYAFASAAVATVGLLAFGWSPTSVLLLFWLETVVLALAPLLAALALIVFRREGLAAAAVLLFLVIVLGVFLGGQALVISVLGLIDLGFVTDWHGTVLTVPLYEPLLVAFRDGSFLAGAAAVVAFALLDVWPRTVIAPSSAPTAPGPARVAAVAPVAPDAVPQTPATTWSANVFTRLLVAQFALVTGGAVVIITQLPSAAALLLVALKLWLDLRGAKGVGAPATTPAG